MLSNIAEYDEKLINALGLLTLDAAEIRGELEHYLDAYKSSFSNSAQGKYFEVFERGLLSGLDRKSIEPIALHLLGETEVRGMQQFFKRTKHWDCNVQETYQQILAETIGTEGGFLSVDESDFVKKGTESAGVARQYCGRLGKRENCQAGVFASYASGKGYGLVAGQLYLPKAWFEEANASRRKACQIPETQRFQTKNEIALNMIGAIHKTSLFPIAWVGCDAAFGSDHNFLDGLPEGVQYFASVRENESVFLNRPKMMIPENSVGRGGRFQHPRPAYAPVKVRQIAQNSDIPWIPRNLGEGVQGPILAQIKCLRCISCRKENRFYAPAAEVWLYNRKYEDETVKYFLCNAPADTPIEVLDKLATLRWSIEQCFQECKSYLGMSHYETRSITAWNRHMLFVMIAHLFTLLLRIHIKKTPFSSRCL